MMLWKCCQFGRLISGHRTGKGHFSFQSHSNPKEGNAKECSNYRTIALISHASQVMLKILQVRLQQYVKHELPVVQAGFTKHRGTSDQIANIHWITEKTKSSRKTSTALLTMSKLLTVWITPNCGKFIVKMKWKHLKWIFSFVIKYANILTKLF